ncbi:PPE family protein [Candidatus Mycobacterium methanotrophicum]|uniref:PPE family protein n=1 Tax=Candidatus Mycobacterium methanotrophicum TaxID=2943498 RepID=A0ABY4QHB8_9MYCO|nr:PPE family protein [Candidatus Mycobacterium methanotrophicum]UQX09926.1 PPE family protein [Candidatus Mycobacterium methanotrophicum]
MLDYAAMPPEITSTLVYTGQGSAPMVATASAWDALAAQLSSFAQGYSSTITALQDQEWTGPASTAMAEAAAPYAAWVSTTATQAEQTATQARAAAAAYETAHASVVPPPLIAANRTQLTNLIATNLLGQNSPQIAATEAQYEQMWAQDASAMYGYATSASSATKLTPFTAPPQTANPAGQSAQAATTAAQTAGSGASHFNSLSQMLSNVPQQLSSAASPAAATSDTTSVFGIQVPNSLVTSIGDFNTIINPISFYAALSRTVANVSAAAMIMGRLVGDSALYAPLAMLSDATSPVTSAAGGGISNAVLASTSTAAPIGPLSVPPSWASATPVATAASEQPLWVSGAEGFYEADSAAGAMPTAGIGPMAGIAGAAAAGMLARPVVSNMLRVAPRRYKMPRPKAGG